MTHIAFFLCDNYTFEALESLQISPNGAFGTLSEDDRNGFFRKYATVIYNVINEDLLLWADSGDFLEEQKNRKFSAEIDIFFVFYFLVPFLSAILRERLFSGEQGHKIKFVFRDLHGGACPQSVLFNVAADVCLQIHDDKLI
ncbi:hypothetical protein CEXT_137851 [Caerostris extrusa]|uniref:Uncharacterized protein n=1 Tax=Caerostris extrusa TaxID=172846 RepID=A0AAV4MPH4_CAEEX|nr:hypothetical protein CEXT_137851 [Caerostris extrusa]